MSDLVLENTRLEETIKIIKDVIKEENDDIKTLTKMAGGNDNAWQTIYDKEYKVKKLKESLEKPYFARIDFQRDDEEKVKRFYIGRRGVMQGSNSVVTDWRAPVSSLYYDGNLGLCNYNAPEGTVTGNMSLKRQFDIEDGKLLSYFDIDLVTGDKLLQKYLEKNNDNRLKTIISTIQKEQNDVIRRRINENIIVDGVAGSGKTTVALHKIAYLVYNYSKTINEDKYLVIGPNPVFLKYIRTVLPDLDVSGVKEYTFEDFAKDYINEDININSSIIKAAESINGNLLYDIDKFKSSMKYKFMLDTFLDDFINSLTSEDLKLKDFIVLNSHIIKKIFNEIDDSYSFDHKIEHTIKRIIKFIKDNNNHILSNYADYENELYNNSSQKDELKKMFVKDRETIKKNCVTEVRRYFSKAKINVTLLYKKFIDSILSYNPFDYENIEILKQETLKNIRKKSYDFEDLASLIYIRKKLISNNKYQKYRHIVIDEAQDLGEFNFYILKEVFSEATFSIFGDLAQSIYDYRSIDSWDKVNSIMFNNSALIVKFKKSYRTTRQIMNVADEVAKKMNLSSSELVLRQGAPVKFVKTDNPEDYIINRIKELKEKYQTIAIISKTDEESIKLNERLRNKGLDIPNITINDDLTNKKYNISTISNQLAKGLEFDAVIINNASVYKEDNKLDLKLLYVAITRALHELDILNHINKKTSY